MQTCRPTGNKRSAKRVKDCKGDIVCVKYGYKSMRIKKNNMSRKKSFCARHKCTTKTNPATPGYQSCKAWNCKTGKKCSKSSKKTTRKPSKIKKSTARKATRKSKAYVSASGRKYTRCWKGYKRKGTKLKNGRRVPNCVKA